jgi:hypothetical protein
MTQERLWKSFGAQSGKWARRLTKSNPNAARTLVCYAQIRKYPDALARLDAAQEVSLAHFSRKERARNGSERKNFRKRN